MQVLKFGGTSVANAENINKVISIVKEALVKDKTIVVVSALGGVTDLLLGAALLASEGNESYKVEIKEFEKRHSDAVKELMPESQLSSLLALVKKVSSDVEDI